MGGTEFSYAGAELVTRFAFYFEIRNATLSRIARHPTRLIECSERRLSVNR